MRISLKRWTQIGSVLGAMALAGVAHAQMVRQNAIKPTSGTAEVTSVRPDTDSTPPMAASHDYVIGPEDVLQISVFNVNQLNQTVRVADDGTIAVPLLGQVRAAGLTTGQLAAELDHDYGKTYLQKPQVSVYVQQYASNPVSVIGAVNVPGLYYLQGPHRLLDVLSMAGGLGKKNTEVAGNWLYVTRESGFDNLVPMEGLQFLSPDKVEINIKKLLYSGNEGLNITIKPGDVITVSKAGVIYVLGRVNHPGGYLLQDRNNVTVMQALAMSGGIARYAKETRARIVRVDANGHRTEIPVNVKRLLKDQSPDLKLEANDILYIPASGSRQGIQEGITAAIATLSGVIMYHGL